MSVMQPFVFMITIKDHSGKQVSNPWLTSGVDSKETIYPEMSWVPEIPRTYDVTFEIFEALESKEVLDDPLHLTLVVDPSTEIELPSKLPDWVRNIFIWYAEDRISEDELLGAIQFLIKEGIIKV